MTIKKGLWNWQRDVPSQQTKDKSLLFWVLIAIFMFSKPEHKVAVDDHNIIQQPFAIKLRAFNIEIRAKLTDALLVGFKVHHDAFLGRNQPGWMPNGRDHRAGL